MGSDSRIHAAGGGSLELPVGSLTDSSPEEMALHRALQLARASSSLRERFYRTRDQNGNPIVFERDLPDVLAEADRLWIALALLQQSLADTALRKRLADTHANAVSYAGEVAPSYVEAICRAGERQYKTVEMLCRHGVLFDYLSRLDSSPGEKLSEPWLQLPKLDEIKFTGRIENDGSGHACASTEQLLVKLCREVTALPVVDSTFGCQQARAYLEKEIAAASVSRTKANTAENSSETTNYNKRNAESDASALPGLFAVNIDLVCESLDRLAVDIEYLASERADNPSDYDAWEHRVNAGQLLARLRAALNNGELERADCDLATLTALGDVLGEIKRLRYGSHHSNPRDYRGPLFLPGEIGPLADDLPVRKADEPYSDWKDALPTLSEETVLSGIVKLKEMRRESDKAIDSDSSVDPLKSARESFDKLWFTTKRQQWGELPNRFRALSAKLTRLELLRSSTEKVIPYDPKLMEAWAESDRRTWDKFSSLRKAVYRHVMPTVWIELHEAEKAGDAERMKAIEMGADREWSEAMGVPAITSFENLEIVMAIVAAAGYPATDAGLHAWTLAHVSPKPFRTVAEIGVSANSSLKECRPKDVPSQAISLVSDHVRPIESIIELAWNLREWLREAARMRTLQPVLQSLLPGIRARLELDLIDGGLSDAAAKLPNGNELSAASLIAFVEKIQLSDGMSLRIPSGEPPVKWESLSRKRALRIAMQVCDGNGERMFDPDNESDLKQIEGMDGFRLADLWEAAVANTTISAPVVRNGKSETLASKIDSLIAAVQAHRSPDSDRLDEIRRLDAEIAAECLRRELKIPSFDLGAHWEPFGQTRIPHVCGWPLENGERKRGAPMNYHFHASDKWLRAMRAVALLDRSDAGAVNDPLPRPTETAAMEPSGKAGDLPKPKQYLRNWREILDALELPNNEESKSWVRRLMQLHAGPIVPAKKRGGQPTVEKGKLIEWWNGLEGQFAESVQRISDCDATVAATHNFGRDGTVAPEIGGSIKRRRTSPKVRKGPKTS